MRYVNSDTPPHTAPRSSPAGGWKRGDKGVFTFALSFPFLNLALLPIILRGKHSTQGHLSVVELSKTVYRDQATVPSLWVTVNQETGKSGRAPFPTQGLWFRLSDLFGIKHFLLNLDGTPLQAQSSTWGICQRLSRERESRASRTPVQRRPLARVLCHPFFSFPSSKLKLISKASSCCRGQLR